jgi:nucleotide-binding universal stress UspA family protein
VSFKILVSTDGSKMSQKAARYAVDLAKRLDGSLTILSVIDARSLISQTVPAKATSLHIAESAEDYLREAAQGYAGEIKNLCDKRGITAKILIIAGHPVEKIVKEAERSKADLIIMGSSGKSALKATVLGSVTYGVLQSGSKIPVLVIRR